MSRNIHRRRGITLLFVISLIVLFLLMGATFVVISGNFMRVSEARTNLEVRGDSAPTILNRALMDVLRGTTNPNSALNTPLPSSPAVPSDHSLLGDMYAGGFKGIVGGPSTTPVAPAPTADANSYSQLIRIYLNVTTPPADPTLLDKVGAFGGQVLTFISNSPTATVKGVSCRIFHYDVQYDATGTPTSRSFLIVPEWTNGQDPFATANVADLEGANVLINGRAFADMPPSPPDAISEPYDALDLQNAFLAGPDFDSVPAIYGSFYHFGNANYEAFRPLPFQATPLADGDGDGWPDLELDNDGDGYKDSIWIDLGYPVQTDSSGRQYKALVAYMALDLDGRCNLNFHGNGDDARGRYTDEVPAYPLLGSPLIVPQGQGYGPSDVSLRGIFNGGFPDPDYLNLLAGNGTYYGRFGPPGPNGIYGTGMSEVQDPWSEYKLFGYPTSGIGNLFGSRMDLKGRYGWGFTEVFDSTGFLPISMPGIDVVPAFNDPGLMPYDYDLVDNPYEMNVAGFPSEGPSENPLINGGSNRLDHPFSYKELERVYRTFDLDSKFLADRLFRLAPSLDATTPGNDPTKRLKVATDSREVPVPPSNSAVELANKIQAAAIFAGVPPTALSQIDTMLSPDIVQGLKMDINSPFGNGVDDNLNGTVDEYDAAGAGELGESVPYPGGAVSLDISRNGQATADAPGLARAYFAKQLYVLALLKLLPAAPLPQGGDFDGDGLDIGNDPADRMALAQWCVNVVDFRDPDAIMTPFEYDDNPFNGWITDGSLITNETADGVDNDGNGLIDAADPNEQSTERIIVWGCERPELLITETLATHDRRTEDTSEGGTFAGGDIQHFDNRLRPEPAAYIELYAPWVAGNDVTYPSELYQASDVDLSRTHNGAANGDPVWRIAISGPDADDDEYGDPTFTPTALLDNRNRDPDAETNAASIDRLVYFVLPPALVFPGNQGVEAFHATISSPLLLPVGAHAVLGSSGNVFGTNKTIFGRRTTAIEGDPIPIADTRSITLDTAAGQVQIEDYHIATGSMVSLTRIALPIPVEFPVVAGSPRRPFNVSDRTGGYPTVDSLGVAAVSTVDGWIYTTPYDEPLDFVGRAATDYEFRCLRDDKTTPTYRVAHLQRLANPLAPWDSVLNPYRTVDSLSMNLTSFNGISTTRDDTVTGPKQDDDSTVLTTFDPIGLETVRDFASMERGRNRKYPPSTQYDTIALDVDEHRNLWSQDQLESMRRGNLYRADPPPTFINEIQQAGSPGWHLSHEPATVIADPDQHIFNSTVFETLGTFNDAWFDHWQGVAGVPPWPVDNNTPSNEPSRVAAAVPPALLGLDAAKPFTWLTWNNRPYVSQYELMLVPSKASSQLLTSFTAKAAGDPYDITAANPTGNGFGHLPNFFLQQASALSVRLELYKLLDFVEVPSRYVGTERYFNATPASTMPVFGLAPPFNDISRFRYPGKVNINTILDRDTWSAVIGEYATDVPAGGPFLDYNVMNASRRDPMSGEFTTPFRETIDPTIGVNGGLLRRSAATDALFSFDPSGGQQAHNNSDRNAYFRYDAIERLGNLVTTRSSVFAIWITVGYFEVDPATGDLLTDQPATCELGSDTGQVKRHRGFFIFDRSIPVGFEQGVDHNIERAIMVESYIE